MDQEQEKSSIPKFGDWEAENTAFTYYFEKTRKVREGKLNSISNSRTESPIRITAQDDNSSLSSHYHQSNASPPVHKRRHKQVSPKIRLVGQNDEIEGKQPKIPKFGEWEDSDPSTADEFTEKFDRVREENKNTDKEVIVKSKADPDFAIVYTKPGKKKNPKVKRSLAKYFSCFGC